MAAAAAAPEPACQGGGTDMLALELTFLSPLGALACLAAVLPVAALVLARTRASRQRTAIGLSGAGPRTRSPAAARSGLLCLRARGRAAGGQSRRRRKVRSDVEALFVVDVSRSMLAAAGPADATRLERAVPPR